MAKSSPKRGNEASTADADGLSGWQQRALDRSLVEARRRALDKSNGFVAAALELLDETGNLNFTVQDVVDRSKLSLRSFYQTFASKDDLLLALFEEQIEATAAWQRDKMEKEDDPVEQIRVFVTNLWAAKLSPEVVRSLALYTMTLSSTRPEDFGRAMEPSLLVLQAAIERGIASGQVRDDIGSRRLAEILLHTGTAAVRGNVFHTGEEGPEDMWAFCLGGLRSRR
jgi:AcrR family transcriptional regulator